MNKPRVLFVDDEPRILDGLRRSLRTRRTEWEMSFVTSGSAALEVLAASPCDVVVSDMRMPGMDGAELLTHVSQLHPEVARVVLSGHTEPEAAIRVAIAGHRFLTKPAEAESVIGVIKQLTTRTSIEHGEQARRIAGAVGCLPTPPDHLDRLTGLLRTPDAELTGIVQVTSCDVGLTAKLLQLSNSVFFGARTKVASIDSAVHALGLPTVQALVDASQVLRASMPWTPDIEAKVRVVWRHALATSWLVGRMASPANRSYAQAAALLQDVGRFVRLLDVGGDGTVELAATDHRDVPHRDIGVELLHLWGLPSPILSAVAGRDLQHRPAPSGLGVSAVVRAAHLLIQQTSPHDPSQGAHEEELTLLLAHPQLTAHAIEWRSAAEEASVRAEQWLLSEPCHSGGGFPGPTDKRRT
jgi:HD-like signal output (HDOD) protein